MAGHGHAMSEGGRHGRRRVVASRRRASFKFKGRRWAVLEVHPSALFSSVLNYFIRLYPHY